VVKGIEVRNRDNEKRRKITGDKGAIRKKIMTSIQE